MMICKRPWPNDIMPLVDSLHRHHEMMPSHSANFFMYSHLCTKMNTFGLFYHEKYLTYPLATFVHWAICKILSHPKMGDWSLAIILLAHDSTAVTTVIPLSLQFLFFYDEHHLSFSELLFFLTVVMDLAILPFAFIFISELSMTHANPRYLQAPAT